MTTIVVGPGGRRITGNHTVRLKQLWQSDWAIYDDAHCVDVIWSCAPTIPTARIVWDYGHFKSVASPAFVRQQKLDVSRWYVKVSFVVDYADETTVDWYGVVSDIQDDHAGLVTHNGNTYATGRQTLYCYGLEHLLNQSQIDSSWVYQGVEELDEIHLPITFNHRGFGNRSSLFIPATGSYVFDGTEEDPTNTSLPFWEEWSTRDIVEYLLYYKSPSRSAVMRDDAVPFRLSYRDRLDDLDTPVVEQEGATVLSLLNRLMDRRRLYSFYLTVNENASPNIVNLVPFTFTPMPIEFGMVGVKNIPANLNQYALVADRDEMTATSLRKIDLLTTDRVIVRGARRTSTCSMFYTEDRFEPAWTSAQETEYEDGASNDAGYAGYTSLKKATRNQEVRARDELRPVFRWFRIPSSWDCRVGDYDSDTLTFPAFIDDDGLAAKQFVHGITVLPYVPLYEGTDYSGAVLDSGPPTPRDRVYRQPFVIFERPTDGRFMLGDKMGQLIEGECDPVTDGNNPRWSASVRVIPHSRIVEVNVSGEPQHVIAATDFGALAADRDLGDFDYKSKGMFVTLCLQECRFAEGMYPPAGLVDNTQIDAQRALVLWAGDEYRQDWVVEDTIVDVATDGSLAVTTNGGYVNDDTDILEAMARVAYFWYQQPRAVMTFTTYRLTDELSVGDIITSIGDWTLPEAEHYEQINSTITQIRFHIPMLASGSMQAPTMTVSTNCGELDPLTTFRRPPNPRRQPGDFRAGPRF